MPWHIAVSIFFHFHSNVFNSHLLQLKWRGWITEIGQCGRENAPYLETMKLMNLNKIFEHQPGKHLFYITSSFTHSTSPQTDPENIGCWDVQTENVYPSQKGHFTSFPSLLSDTLLLPFLLLSYILVYNPQQKRGTRERIPPSENRVMSLEWI